jgi:hypothetical protein
MQRDIAMRPRVNKLTSYDNRANALISTRSWPGARSEKWEPVFGSNARQNKDLEQRSDSLETKPALGVSDPVRRPGAGAIA